MQTTQSRFFSVILMLCTFAAINCHERAVTKEDIIGNWQLVESESPQVYGAGCIAFSAEDLPFKFLFTDSTFESEVGFYKYGAIDTFYGHVTRYSLTENSLKIFDLTSSRWIEYTIESFSANSLVVRDSNDLYYRYGKFNDNTYNNYVSKVSVVASSASYLCPTYEIEVNLNCEVNLKYYGANLKFQIDTDLCNFFWNRTHKINFVDLRQSYIPTEQASHERIYQATFSNGDQTKTIIFSGAEVPMDLIYLLLRIEHIIGKVERSHE